MNKEEQKTHWILWGFFLGCLFSFLTILLIIPMWEHTEKPVIQKTIIQNVTCDHSYVNERRREFETHMVDEFQELKSQVWILTGRLDWYLRSYSVVKGLDYPYCSKIMEEPFNFKALKNTRAEE